jgi:hypothetical protein
MTVAAPSMRWRGNRVGRERRRCCGGRGAGSRADDQQARDRAVDTLLELVAEAGDTGFAAAASELDSADCGAVGAAQAPAVAVRRPAATLLDALGATRDIHFSMIEEAALNSWVREHVVKGRIDSCRCSGSSRTPAESVGPMQST